MCDRERINDTNAQRQQREKERERGRTLTDGFLKEEIRMKWEGMKTGNEDEPCLMIEKPMKKDTLKDRTKRERERKSEDRKKTWMGEKKEKVRETRSQ